MDIQAALQTLSIAALPLLLAVTLHEAAHGYMAKLRGDNTAEMMGRLSLNPVRHVDPIGTILLPGILLLTGAGFLFGYAKPVPVNFSRLKDVKWDTVWVALAGPGANLLLAIISVLLFYILPFLPEYVSAPMLEMLVFSIKINIILMVFNLVPLLPLDGGRVLHALLPRKLQFEFGKTERYGMIVLLVLMFTGVLFKIIEPFYVMVLKLLLGLLAV